MNRLLCLLFALCLALPMVAAEQVDADAPAENLQSKVQSKVFRGKYHTIIDGDTVLMLLFNDVNVFPPLKFKNKKEEEFYWKTVRDVRKALPYAKLICETLVETYEYLMTFDSKAERDRYLKEMEKEVFEQYKPALKRFTKGQAKVLVKLVQRETNQSGYDILKAFLGSFRASFWHGFGRLLGVNINGGYHPDRDRKDGIIERVASQIEMGLL